MPPEDHTIPQLSSDWVASLDLGSARGGRGVKAPVDITYVRDLEPSDLSQLTVGVNSSPPPLANLRETHHFLARCVAEGRKNVEISAMTGFSPSRISILKSDPAFQELVAFYTEDVRQQYTDVHSRLAGLALDVVAELQERVHEAPKSFSHRELREVMDSCLVHVGPAAKTPGPAVGATAAVNLNIQFVEPSSRPSGLVIDAKTEDAA